MRRAAPALPISPKLLKHFAAITLVLTACIALFADGEGREAIQEQVDMRAARNQLIETEAQKLGTKKIGTHLASREKRKPTTFADDGGMIDFSVSESGGGRHIASPSLQPGGPRGPLAREGVPYVPNLPQTPGASVTVKGLSPDQVPGPRVNNGNQRKRSGSIRPSDTQKSEIKEASRVRTGSVSTE